MQDQIIFGDHRRSMYVDDQKRIQPLSSSATYFQQTPLPLIVAAHVLKKADPLNRQYKSVLNENVTKKK